MKKLYTICFLTAVILNLSCKTVHAVQNENITTYALRLLPGMDLRNEISKFVKEKDIKAGWIASCAGSLTIYNIRYANQEKPSSGTGHFEIVSLSGTLSVNGDHIHISISDEQGKTTGGHLVPGCIIYTTAEIIIQTTDKYIFKREKDGSTPWPELQIQTAPKT